jgi:site-specific recombinase XerD
MAVAGLRFLYEDVLGRPRIELAVSPAKGELRERMRRAMVLRGFSEPTQRAYLRRVYDLARHYQRSPQLLDVEEVRAYVLFLIEERKLTRSSVRQAVAALRFLYEAVLGHARGQFEVPLPKSEQKLPEILSREEVASSSAAASRVRERTLLVLTDGGGLRVSAVVRLRAQDLDFRRGMIRVVAGKGRKDRYTLLPNPADLLPQPTAEARRDRSGG